MATREQLHCNKCGKLTLHELDPDSVNHVLHLLVSVFLVGLWLPIWAIIAGNAPRRFMRCRTCGFAFQEVTFAERNAAFLESVKQQQAMERERLAAEEKARAEAWKARRQAVWNAVVATIRSCGRFAATGMTAYNTGLLRLAGGDSFLAGLLWGVIAFGAIAVLGFAVFSTYR